jgi:polysaccharide chain length determinant protein (PEP-CTERM system associated)
MLPGKKYTPEEILHILKRRIWFVLVPFAVIAAGTGLWARSLPNLYRAETLIMIVPQRVPEAYVRSTVTTDIEERLFAIQQQILSRTQLERLITEFDLYPGLRRAGVMQDAADRMLSDIRVQVAQGDAFRVIYVGANPVKVKRVTDELGRLFRDESILDRANQAESTNVFLESELDTQLARLQEKEKALENYRRQHAGELPEQLQANLQVLQNTQLQIQALLESLSNNQERRIQLERLLADLENQVIPVDPWPLAAGGDPMKSGTTQQQLAAQRAYLNALQLRYTDEHPEVTKTRRTIADLEKKAEQEALAAPLSVAGAVALPPAEAERQKRIAETRSQLENVNKEIAAQQEQEKQLRERAQVYQRRAEAAPTRETELIQLTRDYGTMSGMYSNMLAKREDARIATNLETRQQGQTFRILDPARTPERPFSPDRPQLIQIGMLAGLCLGIGLVALLEYRDSSFKTDDDVKAVMGLPVLAVVPLMRSAREKRRGRARNLAVHLTLGSFVLGCLSVLAYTMVW